MEQSIMKESGLHGRVTPQPDGKTVKLSTDEIRQRLILLARKLEVLRNLKAEVEELSDSLRDQLKEGVYQVKDKDDVYTVIIQTASGGGTRVGPVTKPKEL